MDTFLASLVPTQLVPQSKALHSVLPSSWGQQRKGPQLHPQLTEKGPSCTHRGKGLRVDPASGPHPWVSDLTQPGDRAAHARISEDPPPPPGARHSRPRAGGDEGGGSGRRRAHDSEAGSHTEAPIVHTAQQTQTSASSPEVRWLGGAALASCPAAE